MNLLSSIPLCVIFLCGLRGIVEGTNGKHAILATKDKLYLANLGESSMENEWGQHDYQQGEGDDEELKNKRKPTEQDVRSKEDGDKRKKNTKKSLKKKDKKKKKTPFEISGGDVAIPHEFPWTVRLKIICQKNSNIVGFCGGSLISSRLILSAYHCSCNYDRNGQPVDYRALNSVALLGAHNLDDHTYIEKKIVDVKYPPNPNPNTGNNQAHVQFHDFAMFVLNEPVQFSPKIRPICLPTQDQKFSGKKAIAAGWGRTLTVDQSPVLKKIDLNVERSIFKKLETRSRGGQGHSTCPGDSGGPLMYKNTTSYTLIGTTSGIPGQCEGFYVITGKGTFNQVSDWVNWIKKEMQKLGEKTDGKSCGQGLDNNDGGGGNDQGLDNQDPNGGGGLGDQRGNMPPFWPNQNPFFPF